MRFPKEYRDRLGGWSATGSDEYVRTSRKIVHDVQGAIASAIRAGRGRPDFLDEEQVREQMHDIMVAADVEAEDMNEQLLRLHYFEETECIEEVTPTEPVPAAQAGWVRRPFERPSRAPSSPTEVVETSENETIIAAPHTPIVLRDGTVMDRVPVGPPPECEPEGDAPPAGFIISITSRRRMRRLHHASGCWRVPGLDYALFEHHGETLPGPELYDLRCKDCWAKNVLGAQPSGKVPVIEVLDPVDEASSEESSSDSSAGEAPTGVACGVPP
jgi:hypothetical protein